MIGYLRGKIAGIRPNDSARKSAIASILTLDLNGVGYDLIITNSAIANLATMGEEATIYTHLQVREDQMVLFGCHCPEHLPGAIFIFRKTNLMSAPT
jgi:Holliday junction DNA helicase RuvA